MEPTPACPMVSLPGLALAMSIMAWKLATGASMAATKTTGDLTTTTTGTSSRAGSYGRLANMNLLKAACACDGEQQVAAVRRRLCDRGGGQIAAGAGAVFHDERLAELLAQRLRGAARQQIGGAAGREWHHHRHRPARPGLRRRRRTATATTAAAAKATMRMRDMMLNLFEVSRVQTLAVSGVTGACGLPCAGCGLPVARRMALRTVSGSARSTPSTGPPLMVTRSM